MVKRDMDNINKKEIIMKKRNKRKTSETLDVKKAFVMGLKDECPLCGEELDEFGVEEALLHLRDCTDENKHRRYQEKLKREKEERDRKDELDRVQREAQNKAIFDLYGGSSLWMLTDGQLADRATGGQTREEMIQNLSKQDS